MSPRHLALAVAAVAVLGVAVYLFFEVRATPAQAQVAPVTPEKAAEPGPRATERSPQFRPARPEAPTPQPQQQQAAAPERPAVPPDEPVTGPVDGPHLPGTGPTKLELVMDEANKAYDRQDFEEARSVAGKILAKQPNNVRMLRIMVSSSCIEGDNAVAQKYYEQLPKSDREQLKSRCDRYGVTFRDP